MLEDYSKRWGKPRIIIEAGEDPAVEELVVLAYKLDAIFVGGEDDCIVLCDRNDRRPTTKLVRVAPLQELDDPGDFPWSLARHFT